MMTFYECFEQMLLTGILNPSHHPANTLLPRGVAKMWMILKSAVEWPVECVEFCGWQGAMRSNSLLLRRCTTQPDAKTTCYTGRSDSLNKSECAKTTNQNVNTSSKQSTAESRFNDGGITIFCTLDALRKKGISKMLSRVRIEFTQGYFPINHGKTSDFPFLRWIKYSTSS